MIRRNFFKNLFFFPWWVCFILLFMLVLSSGQIYTESLLPLFFYRNGFKMRGLLKKPLKKLPCFIKATGKSILITVINVSGLFFFFSPFFPHVCLKKYRTDTGHWTFLKASVKQLYGAFLYLWWMTAQKHLLHFKICKIYRQADELWTHWYLSRTLVKNCVWMFQKSNIILLCSR